MKTKLKLFWAITMISQIVTLLGISIATNWLDSASYYGGWMLCYVTIPSVVLMFITKTIVKVNNRFVFLIKKGHHYSFHFPKLYFGFKKKFEIRIKLDDNCKYDFGDEGNFDVNKLWGVSFGHHHKNSIRIGYRKSMSMTGGKDFELCLYRYDRGFREIECLLLFDAQEVVNLTLVLGRNTFGLWRDDSLVTRPLYSDFLGGLKFGYYLFPYFGGNGVAPHDMTFEVEVK